MRDELADLIILTAARALLGREVRECLFEKVSTLIHDLDMGMLPISVMFPYLPIPAHNRRDRARKELCGIFTKVIATRRAKGTKEVDVLQSFMDARCGARGGAGRGAQGQPGLVRPRSLACVPVGGYALHVSAPEECTNSRRTAAFGADFTLSVGARPA